MSFIEPEEKSSGRRFSQVSGSGGIGAQLKLQIFFKLRIATLSTPTVLPYYAGQVGMKEEVCWENIFCLLLYSSLPLGLQPISHSDQSDNQNEIFY